MSSSTERGPEIINGSLARENGAIRLLDDGAIDPQDYEPDFRDHEGESDGVHPVDHYEVRIREAR